MTTESKVCLVTGASRGIGAAISDQLGNLGYTVIGTATSASGAEKIDQRFKEQGIEGAGMVLNVTDSQSISDLLENVGETYGAPSVLVNNAGITKDNLLLRMKDDEWFDVINTNLSSIFRLSRACLKPMTRARWGRIVNISSVVGSMGNGGQPTMLLQKPVLLALRVLWRKKLVLGGLLSTLWRQALLQQI